MKEHFGWKIVALWLYYVQLKPEETSSSKSAVYQNFII
jgi:hypothetical protein